MKTKKTKENPSGYRNLSRKEKKGTFVKTIDEFRKRLEKRSKNR